MKILNSIQMKEMDKSAIEEIGIIGPILMENAGVEIFKEIIKRFPRPDKENIVIIAGKGNNGGDGFVVARHLFNRGYSPHILLLAEKTDPKGDAGLNLDIADNMGISITEITSQQIWEKENAAIFKATVLVDAIFGTGLTKAAKGIYSIIIEDLNKAEAYKVAIDIPSGLSSDSFELIGPCVNADLTVTMAAAKIAHVFPPAEENVGELVIADISMPPFMFERDDLKLEMVEENTIIPYFEKRKKDAHKGTYGHIFMLAGSTGKTGAAVMAGKAALKMGAGLVTLGTPRSCLPLITRSMDELMTEPLKETPQQTLAVDSLDNILNLTAGKDAVLIGPGISTNSSTTELILSLIPRLEEPLIIDADGLNIIASSLEILKSLSQPVVLTPHPGEFARLCKMETNKVVAKKLELVPEFAQEYGIYLVLKGYRTITATPEGRVYINPTGNPGMATGGSGDVLSGMITSMMVQEESYIEPILAAVYLHGLSGDIAEKNIGEKALIAGDIINFLPQAIKELSDLGYE